jgi:hypothetical protein
MKGENIKMRFSDFYIHSVQVAKKAVGRVRRRLVKLPEVAVIRTINRTVRFEHEFLRYLDEDDFRAMLTEATISPCAVISTGIWLLETSLSKWELMSGTFSSSSFLRRSFR